MVRLRVALRIVRLRVALRKDATMFELYVLAMLLTGLTVLGGMAYGKVHRHRMAPHWPT